MVNGHPVSLIVTCEASSPPAVFDFLYLVYRCKSGVTQIPDDSELTQIPPPPLREIELAPHSILQILGGKSKPRENFNINLNVLSML